MQKASYNTITHFKKLLIIFWGLWWLTALWTDVAGGLAHIGWLHADWAPAKNYPFLLESLKMYQPHWIIPALFFLGIIFWMCLIAIYYLRSILSICLNQECWHGAHLAFFISMGLWLAFLIADQMIMNYDLEANHMVQASFQLISWIFLLLVDNSIKK